MTNELIVEFFYVRLIQVITSSTLLLLQHHYVMSCHRLGYMRLLLHRHTFSYVYYFRYSSTIGFITLLLVTQITRFTRFYISSAPPDPTSLLPTRHYRFCLWIVSILSYLLFY